MYVCMYVCMHYQGVFIHSFIFGCATKLVRSQFPEPRWWKSGILTTKPPGKPPQEEPIMRSNFFQKGWSTTTDSQNRLMTWEGHMTMSRSRQICGSIRSTCNKKIKSLIYVWGFFPFLNTLSTRAGKILLPNLLYEANTTLIKGWFNMWKRLRQFTELTK